MSGAGRADSYSEYLEMKGPTYGGDSSLTGNRILRSELYAPVLLADGPTQVGLGPIDKKWGEVRADRMSDELSAQMWAAVVAARDIPENEPQNRSQSRKKSTADLAKDRIVVDNIGLVFSQISRFEDGSDPMKDRTDIFQWGVMGLMAAVDKFDPARGNKFSTYAVPKINSVITREMDKAFQSRFGSSSVDIASAQAIREAHGRAIANGLEVEFDDPIHAELSAIQTGFDSLNREVGDGVQSASIIAEIQDILPSLDGSTEDQYFESYDIWDSYNNIISALQADGLSHEQAVLIIRNLGVFEPEESASEICDSTGEKPKSVYDKIARGKKKIKAGSAVLNLAA